ncbi:MAG: head maturation protease, ClpP-related, partial [Gammaproteobacteria bacterium]
DIGDGWMGGLSAKRFADELNALGKLTEINVRINSPGGSVFDGVAIYNTLVKNGANIIVDIDGLAASISSVIAMAGNEIRIASNALLMIHDPWGVFAGNADELRRQAELMDKVKGTLLDTYMNRAKASKKDVEQMMKDETWMTADEALENGFVDSVTDEMKMAAHFDLKRFKHPPKLEESIANVVQIEPVTNVSARTALDYMNVRTKRY